MNNKTVIKKLIRNVVILFVTIVVMIFIQQKVYNDYVSENISISYLSELALRAESQFTSFYQPVVQHLTVFQKWGQSGLLVLHDTENINARFIPILQELSQVHSVKIVNEKQEVFALTRMTDHWISYMIKNEEDPHNVLMQYWSHDGEFIKKMWSPTKYDAFQRPWYKDAVDSAETNQPWWTKLRYIESAENFGITASVKWPVNNQKNQLSVLAFDILLKEFYKSVANMRVSQNSEVLLIRLDERVLSLSTIDSLPRQEKDPEKLFLKHDQLENIHISRAITSWKEIGKPIDDPISISYNNTKYWFGVKFIDGARSKLWIGIIIPENDIINQLKERQIANISISASILLFGILFSILMIRKYRNQLTSVSRTILDADNPEVSLNELISKGESGTLEFKSTMRMNLNTNQSGKEIELAWLKAAAAFMNSEGGIVLLGVNDSGEFVGLEPDNFENEDKCLLHFKNLINQHIGAEFTGYLNFGILKINDKTIAVLECKPSPKPIFLKNKSEEHFYIRSGPSSIKLQTSKILEYIEDRKA